MKKLKIRIPVCFVQISIPEMPNNYNQVEMMEQQIPPVPQQQQEPIQPLSTVDDSYLQHLENKTSAHEQIHSTSKYSLVNCLKCLKGSNFKMFLW